ncbi:MAG: hypothetical protein RLZZ138_498 [Actinomycetota bacterium]|jgi:integrase
MAQLPKGIRRHTSRPGFEVRVTFKDPLTGASRRFSSYAKSLPEAKQVLREMNERSRQSLLVKDSQITLSSWAEEWVREFLSHKPLATSTKRLYSGLLSTHVIEGQIGQLKLSNLSPLRMEKFFQSELINSSASLRRNVYTVLSQLFSDAVRARVIGSSPLREVARPKSTRQESRFISKSELSTLMESLKDSRYVEVFNLILQTGLRRGEALALSWENVDFGGGQIQVRASLGADKKRGPLKTAKSLRTLDLNSTAIAILKRQKARQNLERLSLGALYSPTDWDPVFTTESGSPVCPRALLRVLQNAAQKSHLVEGSNLGSIGVHTLRHYVASKLLTSGVDMLVVSRILGHESIQTTVDIYGHVEDSSRKSALALLA